MNEFLTFVQMGIQHITDPTAFDHMLFVITLCAVYELADWKRILMLITAFTVGHSITLVLSGLELLQVPSELVELLIPITILLTALHNVGTKKNAGSLFSKAVSINYLLALFFGLIHGMGFANYFRSLMGETGSIAWPLFSFNVGIELGQLVIVAAFYGLFFILTKAFAFKHRDWNLFVSGAGAGGSLILIVQGYFG